MTLQGLLLIDKPQGPTSHDIISQLRRITGIRRIGHAGTLDPLATGLLLVAVGRATRLLEYLQDQPKRYEAAVRLGQRTDTFDAQGRVLAEKTVKADALEIEQALAQFRGPIQQFAPAYSAVKRDGVPLYKLARQGLDIERPSRDVIIYSLELIAWDAPTVHLDIACSAGTYIRTIADDLGAALGCGGHISALRRTSIGSFSAADALSPDDLQNSSWADYLLPMESAVGHLPRVDFSSQAARQLLLGQQAPGTGTLAEGTPARAFNEDSRFLGIVLAAGQAWQPHKMFPDEGPD